jgi:predicted lipid carrier protein YhbT
MASDGIDEYLQFLPVRAGDDAPAELSGSWHFHTTDVPGEWVVVFADGGVTVTREHAKSDVAVRGPASDLELCLYNRRGDAGLEVFGDPARFAAWRDRIRF